jgi:hypothetical protein
MIPGVRLRLIQGGLNEAALAAASAATGLMIDKCDVHLKVNVP